MTDRKKMTLEEIEEEQAWRSKQFQGAAPPDPELQDVSWVWRDMQEWKKEEAKAKKRRELQEKLNKEVSPAVWIGILVALGVLLFICAAAGGLYE